MYKCEKVNYITINANKAQRCEQPHQLKMHEIIGMY